MGGIFYLFNNMMKTQNEKTRNVAIDALRGFAVMGIILLHNIEHFNPNRSLGFPSVVWQ